MFDGLTPKEIERAAPNLSRRCARELCSIPEGRSLRHGKAGLSILRIKEEIAGLSDGESVELLLYYLEEVLPRPQEVSQIRLAWGLTRRTAELFTILRPRLGGVVEYQEIRGKMFPDEGVANTDPFSQRTLIRVYKRQFNEKAHVHGYRMEVEYGIGLRLTQEKNHGYHTTGEPRRQYGP